MIHGYRKAMLGGILSTRFHLLDKIVVVQVLIRHPGINHGSLMLIHVLPLLELSFRLPSPSSVLTHRWAVRT